MVGKSRLPQPATPTYEQLADGSFDSRFIEISGVVRSAQVTTMWGRPILLVSLQMPGGSISLHVLDYAHLQPEAMVDSTITARGVCGTKFNDRKQIIGLRLFVAGPADLKIQAAPPNVSNIPTSAIPLVQRYSPGSQSQHRVKVAGTLTYQSGEEGIYLEQDGFAIHVRTNQSSTFQLGDRLEALGFTWSDGYSPGLHDAQLRVVSHGSQVQPLAAQPGDILIEKDGFGASQFDGRLVQLTAEVVEQLPNSRDQLWLLRRGKLLFQAELSGSPNAVSLEPKSEVSVVGVCVIEVDESGQPTAFRLLLRSPGRHCGDAVTQLEAIGVCPGGRTRVVDDCGAADLGFRFAVRPIRGRRFRGRRSGPACLQVPHHLFELSSAGVRGRRGQPDYSGSGHCAV